jgi:hypothetical protein
MPTQKITLTDQWTEVATDVQNFIIENISSVNVRLAFNPTTPALNFAYHTLQAGEVLVRAGVSGRVYMMRDDQSTSPSIVVSTS